MQELPTSGVTAHSKSPIAEAVHMTDVDPNPELIQEDLYFGRNIAGVGKVSEEEFQAFLSEYITPRFPDGLTVYDADGQYLDSTGTLIQEQSKVVSLIFEDTSENEEEIDEIIQAYKQQFQQESLLEVVDEDIEIFFTTTDEPVISSDIPIGGAGSDTLTGGAGEDCFTFNALNQRADIITDLMVADDYICVLAKEFGGGLTAGAFFYNDTNGALCFDKDGLEGAAQVQLATLIGVPILTNASILAI